MKRIALLLGMVAFVLSNAHSVFAVESLKKTVAVFDFENDSGFAGYVSLGQDFGTQLSDALIKTGKFIVLSRLASIATTIAVLAWHFHSQVSEPVRHSCKARPMATVNARATPISLPSCRVFF